MDFPHLQLHRLEAAGVYLEPAALRNSVHVFGGRCACWSMVAIRELSQKVSMDRTCKWKSIPHLLEPYKLKHMENIRGVIGTQYVTSSKKFHVYIHNRKWVDRYYYRSWTVSISDPPIHSQLGSCRDTGLALSRLGHNGLPAMIRRNSEPFIRTCTRGWL